MNPIIAILSWWRMRTHDCYHESEGKGVRFDDLWGMPNPLSIYGNMGSWWGSLYHCMVCGHYWGRKYDTYGGQVIEPEEAKRLWAVQVDGQIPDIREGAPPEWEVERFTYQNPGIYGPAELVGFTVKEKKPNSENLGGAEI